ncbi:MAG: hypothetical protein ACC742_02920 [Thermoanaerobaculales bacterium]
MMIDEISSADWSRRVLRDASGDGRAIEELQLSDGSIRLRRCPWEPDLPMVDEPQLEAWVRTLNRADVVGAWSALEERFVQLRFPVRAGMSQDPDYLRATRRGEAPDPGEGGLELARPEDLELTLHPSLGGAVPVIVAPYRRDFETLVQALSRRNEPQAIPAAQGACLVSGLNDWERIQHHRQLWNSTDPSHGFPGAWDREFARLRKRRELYQDRFIVVGEGPYSDVDAAGAGFDEAEWMAASRGIRLEHECTHFFALRAFGSLRHDLLEELVADFVGLARTLGGYRQELALRFLGLEEYPHFRRGGRLEVYRGDPPLSDAAFKLLQRVAWMGCNNLTTVAAEHPDLVGGTGGLANLVTALTTLPLAALASDELPALVTRIMDRMGGRLSRDS